MKPHWTLFPGVQNGNIIGHNLTSSICSSFDFIHEEFACLDHKIIYKLIPRPLHFHIPIKLFTILRHPIERIGAQAFYGENSIGYSILYQRISQNCFENNVKRHFTIRLEINECERERIRKNGMNSRYCECIKLSMEEGLQELQTNETLWFNWFNKSSSFGDDYMPNYYLKRLLTGHHLVRSSEINLFNSCIKKPTNRCVNISLLSYLTPSSRCLITSLPNSTISIHLATKLLENYFDIFILERYNQSSTTYFFINLLRESNLTLINHLLYSFSSNSGVVTLFPHLKSSNSTSSMDSNMKYSSLLPQKVYDFLQKDNYEDIQIYNFATKLYDQRIKEILDVTHESSFN